MKIKYYPALIVLLLLTVLYFSCKKDRFSNTTNANESHALTVQDAQDFFNKQVLPNSPLTLAAKKSKGSITFKDIQQNENINDLLYKEPVWDKAYYKPVSDGIAIAVPIHFQVKSFVQTSSSKGVNFDNLNYLLITQKNNGEIIADWVTLSPDLDWIRGDRKDYFGRIIVRDWDGNVKKITNFDRGGKEVTGYVTYKKYIVNGADTGKRNKVINKLQTDYQGSDGKCYQDDRTEISPDGFGITLYRHEVGCTLAPAPPPQEPCTSCAPKPGDPLLPGSSKPGDYKPELPLNCNPDPNYKVPKTPPPNGTTYVLPCSSIPQITEDPLKPDLIPLIKDPCSEKADVSKTAIDPTIKAQNDKIAAYLGNIKQPGISSSSKEYGADQKLKNEPGTSDNEPGTAANPYLNTAVRTDNQSNTWGYNFSWDSTNGYWIGAAHDHPAGDGIDPGDIFSMMINFNAMKRTTTNPSAIWFYQENVSITTITSANTYVVTVNDWTAFQTVTTQYQQNTAQFTHNFQTIAGKYLGNNFPDDADNPTSAEKGEACVSAILSMFGNAVNIYHAPTAGAGSYEPLTTDGSGKVATLGCP